MTALSANASRTFRMAGTQRFKVAASQTIWKGAAVGVRASDGLAREWDATSGDRFVGFASAKVVTNSSGYVEKEGVPEGYNSTSTTSGYVVVLAPERIVQAVTITGLDNQTDVLHPVWMTDDNTFTLTPQANQMPVGYVIAIVSTSAGTADVAIFNFDSMGGAIATDLGYQRQYLAAGVSPSAINTTHTTGLVVTDLPLLGAGKATKLFIITGRKASLVTCAIKFKLKIGTTFLKNTAGTFQFSVTATQLKTAGQVVTVNLAHSSTNPAYFGPGDNASVTAKCATQPNSVGDFSVLLESARMLNG